jgi:hypothetical protein
MFERQVRVAMRGMAYVDREAAEAMRISFEPEGIPKGFPIVGEHEVVDYDWAEIGGARFLLPRRASLRLEGKDGMSRNVKEFVNYRKFTSEAKIDFEKQ